MSMRRCICKIWQVGRYSHQPDPCISLMAAVGNIFTQILLHMSDVIASASSIQEALSQIVAMHAFGVGPRLEAKDDFTRIMAQGEGIKMVSQLSFRLARSVSLHIHIFLTP
jgi:hypothetical protein